MKYLGKIAFYNEFVAKLVTNISLGIIKVNERIFELDLSEDLNLCHEEVNYKRIEVWITF